MGDADFFMIYEWNGNEYQFVEKRSNVPFEEEKHGSQKKMQHILKIVGDCDVFIGGVLSPNFLNLRDKTSVQPVVSKIEEIEKTLDTLNKHAKVIEELVQSRKEGKRPRAIPRISEDGIEMLH